MSKLYFIGILFFMSLHPQRGDSQIFVNQNASGFNDGTSWENAYIFLDDALIASSPNDQIFVAAGVYTPGRDKPSPDNSFFFQHDIELYGGFSGTETTLSQRDWTVNQTILSGDQNRDDIDGDFFSNKTDNSIHVMSLTNIVTNRSTIDGFIIRNGQTKGLEGSSLEEISGGGIFTSGNPSIRNCIFTQNFGLFGGGIFPSQTDLIIIEDCIFENNLSGVGGGINFNSDSSRVHNCTFNNNEAFFFRGGAIYLERAKSTEISNCLFNENISNSVDGGGGAIAIDGSADSGAFDANITDCVFTNNSATIGGAIVSLTDSVTLDVINCSFSNNSAVLAGGAIANFFGSSSNLTNCTFNENVVSDGSGGAVFCQNNDITLNVNQSNFLLNSSSSAGGAISIVGDIDPSSVEQLPQCNINESFFTLNLASDDGGALSISDADLNLSNSVITSNIVFSPAGTGGGVSLSTSESIQTIFNITNATIAANSAPRGSGISQLDFGDNSSSLLTLQNNIFDNTMSDNYTIENGTLPVVVSNGGNLSHDASMSNFLISTNDLNVTSPVFVDSLNGDYHLQNSSPCIDKGISSGAPLTDIEGLPRVGEVDMGAFENQMLVNIKELNKYFGTIDIFPNPVQDNLNFVFQSNWNGKLEIQITNLEGKVVHDFIADKKEKNLVRSVDVSNLTQGVYQLSFSNGHLVNSVIFIK